MRDRSRPARTRAAASLALTVGACVVAAAIGACAGRDSGPKPVASLASSPQAAAAFEAVRDAWRDTDPSSAPALRAKVEAFLVQFPNDGLIPLARIALAFAAMRSGDLATADAELARTADIAPGTTHDLWTIAKARRLRLGGDAESALGYLRPLVGKNVDPLARAIFEEDLTLTALATHREYEAISYMDAWLRASTEEEKGETIQRVTEIVQRLPRDVLVGALQAMRAQRATLGYGVDIQRILAERLVQIATTSGDAELARTLLEADPEAFAVAGDAGAALGELATSRRGLNVVEGRTLGLLLPTESPGLRDESADVLRGIQWALGLPRGTRESSPPAAAGGGLSSSSRTAPFAPPCAPLEAAPDLGEPTPEQGVHFVTRNDSGSADRTEVSLDELAGEGAAIIIAGLDEKTAERALRWGQEHRVPVIALVSPPPAAGAPPAFGFVLGEPRGNVLEALARGTPAIATETATPIADSSDVGWYPAQGGRVAGLTLAPPVSCDIPSVRAGEARFPIGQWQVEKTHAWIVSGSTDCAIDLVTELSGARLPGIIALTLEAAAPIRPPSGLRVVSAQVGVVPATDPRDPRDEEVHRFSAVLGHAGWWTALGRDAATLARAALLELPTDSVSDAAAVAERRATARDRLAAARARLWTTEAGTWREDRTMKRVVCATVTAAP
jgi:hypothetical protein